MRIFYQVGVGFFYVSPSIKKIDPKYHPLVSVLVPAWNEEVGIRATINSVMRGSYKNIEVIVINDGSTDGTSSEVLSTKKRYYKNGYKIRLINKVNYSGRPKPYNHIRPLFSV